MYITWT